MEYFIEPKTKEEMLLFVECIEKCILANDYENAFCKFLLFTEKMNGSDRTVITKHFKNFMMGRYVSRPT